MNEKKQAVAKQFTNWTDEKFSHTWNGDLYNFEIGQTMMLQEYLADHFAKHLAQREINKAGLLMTDLKYKEFKDRCFGKEIEAETELKLEMKIEEEKQASSSVEKAPVENTDEKKFVCEFCGFEAKSKAGLIAHMRGCDKQPVNEEEKEFEDLNDESTK